MDLQTQLQVDSLSLRSSGFFVVVDSMLPVEQAGQSVWLLAEAALSNRTAHSALSTRDMVIPLCGLYSLRVQGSAYIGDLLPQYTRSPLTGSRCIRPAMIIAEGAAEQMFAGSRFLGPLLMQMCPMLKSAERSGFVTSPGRASRLVVAEPFRQSPEHTAGAYIIHASRL